MSDSDDDWFDKDIDDFVVDRKDKQAGEDGTTELLPDQFLGGPSNAFFDSDYGGNYNKNISSKKPASSADQKPGDVGDSRSIQPISYKKLSFILELTSLNVFLEILQPDSGFIGTINRATISNDIVALTLKAIGRIISLPLNEHRKCFLKKILEAKNYWKQIEGYMKSLTTEQKVVKIKKKVVVPNVAISDKEFWENCLLLCRNIIKYYKFDEQFFERAIKMIGESKQESKLFRFKEQFQQLQKIVQEREEKVSGDIYPTLDELKDTQPITVKPNIVKGKFPSIEHYLDVHLSLLREDVIAPLRDGINQFRQESENGKFKSNNDIKLYKKVRILTKQKNNTRSHKGEYLMVDLMPDSRDSDDDKPPPDNMSNLSYSKKLMYGSLLVLTTTHEFNDLILAVVSNRDTELLNQGYIQIEIIKTYNLTLVFDVDFIMLESEVYFEPYHQVYRVLNHFDEDTFPMANYIIDIDPTQQYPGYVAAAPKAVYSHRKYALDLRNLQSWPAAHQLKMNESQFAAYKNSLTNQFSVIQGPPGTGKTFIGLEILSTLIKNTDEQILIICYTNHALDQFLMGVLNVTEDIVRMGNQSKNEHLDRFNVKQLTENAVSDKRMKTCFYKAKLEYAELMQKFEELQSKMGSIDERSSIEHKMLDIQNKLRSISRKQEELKQIAEYNVLKSKRVIGMTSTCAARCNSLIQLLKTPIVLIEEAAEILEPHIVAALTRDTQHLILIGDHQQLRPTTSCYKLAKECKMDISLFERMVINGINSVKLNVQHRMRPEIANLIRPTIYKDLLDHESVQNKPNILGVQKNLFFINHTQAESKDKDETSKKNIFEAQYLVALCNYFILQGYAPEEVTILTTYNGQMFQFSQERRKYPKLRKVRITVVDNYQGEESKIILLSLVRSNSSNSIGYLALKNRVCVALSRAKDGFYIVGNMELLASNSSVWREIEKELQSQNAIGDELSVCCQTHGNVTQMRLPSDFEKVKFGGCENTCSTFVECGHQCSYFCHTNSVEHYSSCECKK